MAQGYAVFRRNYWLVFFADKRVTKLSCKSGGHLSVSQSGFSVFVKCWLQRVQPSVVVGCQSRSVKTFNAFLYASHSLTQFPSIESRKAEFRTVSRMYFPCTQRYPLQTNKKKEMYDKITRTLLKPLHVPSSRSTPDISLAHSSHFLSMLLLLQLLPLSVINHISKSALY